jgi:hypothetical protein
MEPSNIEEQTPEEKLVDELVGIRMQIEGKVKEDAPVDKQREIKSVVKKAWVNGASCEEIEDIYYDYVRNSIESEEKNAEQKEFSRKLSDFGAKTKKEFQKIEFNFVPNNDIKNNVLSWWKNRVKSEAISETNTNNNNNNKYFNKRLLNKKTKKLEKNEYENSDFQSFADFDEEKYKQENMKKELVDKLVGLGSSFGEELGSLNILDIYKLAIKSTVQSVWRDGRSFDEIQKTYDDLATKHLQDKEELEKQKLLKKELNELKKESIIKEELKNEKLKFEGYIQEIKKDFLHNKDKEFYFTALLEDNTIFIEKKKPISKTFCGENKILYLDILSAVYEKENRQYEYIQIYTEGFIFKLINKNRNKNLKDFYDKLMERINKDKICNSKNNIKKDIESYSDADELMKWYELKEKGVITQEEFENKKSNLL